jgi:PPOX class probable F420-dependent enzyme
MRSRVAGARVARLATVRPDGRPRLVPCVFALHGDTLYSAVDHKPKTTSRLARLSDIAADDRVTVLVDHYEEDWSALWWVRLDGRARVLTDGDERTGALDLLAAKFHQYRDRRPDAAVVAVDITTWTGWSARPPG